MKSIQFGVAAQTSEQGEGILGLSFGSAGGLGYNNFVDELQIQKQTKFKAFSITLGNLSEANGGSIVFGGVDTKKFSGQLHKLEMLNSGAQDGNNMGYWVQLDSVGLSLDGAPAATYGNSSSVVLLDTGTEISNLPLSVLNQLAESMNATWSDFYDLYMVDCDIINRPGTVDFTFSGYKVGVPFSQFIWEFSAGYCGLGATPTEYASDSINILGTYFLRGALVVYDQSSPAIWMAEYTNCGESIEEIQASGIDPKNFRSKCT